MSEHVMEISGSPIPIGTAQASSSSQRIAEEPLPLLPLGALGALGLPLPLLPLGALGALGLPLPLLPLGALGALGALGLPLPLLLLGVLGLPLPLLPLGALGLPLPLLEEHLGLPLLFLLPLPPLLGVGSSQDGALLVDGDSEGDIDVEGS
jgi:hypothetical protein